MAVVAQEAVDPATASQPLMLGYLCAHLLMTDRELADSKHDLERFADQEGFRLGSVFVERIDQAPTAFGALLEAIENEQAKAVAIPSMLHLAPLGLPSKLIYYLEATTGIRVLIASRPP